MDPENDHKWSELTSPPLTDQMNTLFSNLSASTSSPSNDMPRSPVAPARAIEDVGSAQPDQTSNSTFNSTDAPIEPVESMNDSFTNASENGESIQSLDTLVEPSPAAEPLKEIKEPEVSNRGRPSGGRPLPSHMKFS